MENPFTPESETRPMNMACKIILIFLTVIYGFGFLLFSWTGINFELVVTMLYTLADSVPTFDASAAEMYEKIGASGFLWQLIPVGLHLIACIFMLCRKYWGFLVYVFGTFAGYMVGFIISGSGFNIGSLLFSIAWLYLLHYLFVKLSLGRKY